MNRNEVTNMTTTRAVVEVGTLTWPLTINHVHQVDDAGGTHLECVMTAGYIVDLYESGLLTQEGNLRGAHYGDASPTKTRKKINRWIDELIVNNAVIGNISMRLDPTKSEYEVLTDADGNSRLELESGHMDCAVDSLSRIKAILGAANHPLGGFDLNTRFQVRIWIADDELAARVGANYNTRGERVNESTAKYKAPEGPEQRIAQNLVKRSPHLGIENVEIHAMSVSARSAKLTAFSTISKAIEKSWRAGPVGPADVEAQSAWIISAWNSLVSVRPEFGRFSTPVRIETRKNSVAGSSVTIHALIGAMSTIYLDDTLDPNEVFPKLAQQAGEKVDFFDLKNPIWQENGVVSTSRVTGRLGVNGSFPARRGAAKIIADRLGIPVPNVG
jgi:DNA-sulfur modification-associated